MLTVGPSGRVIPKEPWPGGHRPPPAWLDRGVWRSLELRLPAAVLHRPGSSRRYQVITIGIDPHKSSHTAVALDPTGRVVGELRVPAQWARSNHDFTTRLDDSELRAQEATNE